MGVWPAIPFLASRTEELSSTGHTLADGRAEVMIAAGATPFPVALQQGLPGRPQGEHLSAGES